MTDRWTFCLQLCLLLCIFDDDYYWVHATVFQCQSIDPCGCSQNHAHIRFGLAGSEPITQHSWTWVVSIRNADHIHICGGSIVSNHFILTAAHCLQKVSNEEFIYSVLIGVDSLLSTDGQIRTVSRIIFHPLWNSNNSILNDIALLELNQSISMTNMNVNRICLPDLIPVERRDQYPMISSWLVTVGWRIASSWEDPFLPMYLRQMTLNVISEDEWKCHHLIHNRHSQFCATVRGGEKDTCQGDSGGPIMEYSWHHHRWLLVGIISYGYQCARRDYVGVYTRLSIYIDWIRSIVGQDGLVTIRENRTNLLRANYFQTILIGLYITLLDRLSLD